MVFGPSDMLEQGICLCAVAAEAVTKSAAFN
jgi:hypothetical protein